MRCEMNDLQTVTVNSLVCGFFFFCGAIMHLISRGPINIPDMCSKVFTVFVV